MRTLHGWDLDEARLAPESDALFDPPTIPVEQYLLHTPQIETLAVRRDGRRIATGAADGRVQVFDVPSRRIVHTISTEERSISALAFSPAQDQLAIGTWDKRLSVWDLDEAREVWSATAHRELVSALAYSADGAVLASGSMDTTIRLWNADQGDQLGQLSGHGANVTGITFLRGSEHLASFDEARVLKTWRWRRDEVPVARGEFNRIHGLAIASDVDVGWVAVLESPDASWRNSCVSLVDTRRRYDGSVEIREIESHRCTFRYPEAPNRVTRACAFSPDGERLAIQEGKVRILVVSASDGRVLADRSVEGTIVWPALSFSPDGRLLVPLMFGNDLRLSMRSTWVTFGR